MAQQLDDEKLALILTVLNLLDRAADPRRVRHEYSRALAQIDEFKNYPDDSEHDEATSR